MLYVHMFCHVGRPVKEWSNQSLLRLVAFFLSKLAVGRGLKSCGTSTRFLSHLPSVFLASIDPCVMGRAEAVCLCSANWSFCIMFERAFSCCLFVG